MLGGAVGGKKKKGGEKRAIARSANTQWRNMMGKKLIIISLSRLNRAYRMRIDDTCGHGRTRKHVDNRTSLFATPTLEDDPDPGLLIFHMQAWQGTYLGTWSWDGRAGPGGETRNDMFLS